MSSGTITPPPLPQEAPLVVPPTEYEHYIDQRLSQTRRQVKTVDIAGGAATLAIGVLLYLLAAALTDHWLVIGGLGPWGRWLLWLGLVAAAGTYFIYCLLPPLVYRVNPIFAASTIENSRPSLRNSLINFLLLRGRRRELAAPVYNALEQRAASDLTTVRVETAVDRTHLVRLCCALAAVLAMFLLYLVFSPKNPLLSAARVIFPWSSVEAPTRVTIREVRPGDTAAFHGEFIDVSAEVAGLRDGEKPLLIYSTADGQIVDQAIPMTRPEGEYRHQCRLPPGKLGLQQDYRYHLSAGDCRTRGYLIDVRSAPAIVVDKVVYNYPGYTGLADQTIERQGDLRAIEGTEATIHATANAEIKPGTAEIDLGCSGRRGLRMSSDGGKAVGGFRLNLNPEDDNAPQYDSYQLRFSDPQGRENPRPVRHRIDVVRDLPPDVQLIEPRQREVPVAENGKLTIRVRAEDPDFALRQVAIRAVRDDRNLSIPPLLEKRGPEKAVQGEFQGEYVFQPARLGLKAGDRVQYWAQAEDNREPTANRSETEKRWIVVAGREAQDEKQQQEGTKDGRPDQPKEQERSDERSDQRRNAEQQPQDQPPEDPAEKQQSQDGTKSPNGERSGRRQEESSSKKQDPGQSTGKQQGENQSAPDNQNGEGQPRGDRQGEQRQDGLDSDKPDRRVDPEAEPGDAMQEILKDHQLQQKNQQPQDGSRSENQQSRKQQNDKQQPGEKPQTDGRQQTGKPSQTDEPQSGDKRQPTDHREAGNEQSSPDKQREEKSGQRKSSGEQPAGSEAGREKGGPDKSGGKESAAGDDAKGQVEGGDDKSEADKSNGAKEPGRQSAERPKDGDNGPSEKSDDNSAGGERSGSKRGENQQSDKTEKSTEGIRPGEKKSGQQDTPGADQKPTGETGSPLPQEEAQPGNKQRPEGAGDAPGERKEDDAQSPSKGNKESDARSDTSGDRKGEGQKGGGQQSNQPGVGGPGSNTPADEGASRADERGEGETGHRAGDRQASEKPTGSEQKSAADGRATPGSEQKAATGGRAPARRQTDSAAPDQRGEPPESTDNSGIPTEKSGTDRDSRSSGIATGGGKPGKSDSGGSVESSDSTADRANLDYARRQTELALEHLRDQLAKEKPELLERLGWTKDDARRFLARWEEMQRAAEQTGAAGEKARKEFVEALKSLGLRPRGTELKHGGVEADKSDGLPDAGRFAPPPDWEDHFRAYTRGIAGGDHGDDKDQK